MHNPAAHSVVSDALVKLAHSTPDTEALDAARLSVAQARQRTADARSTALPLRALQDGDAADARLNAWALGNALSTHGEPSAATPVIAAAVAMGAPTQASDDEIAAAVAVGTRATERLLNAVDGEGFRARWNVTSSLGIVGATLAVARLLALDELQTRHALGIAATQAAGLARNAHEAMGALEVGKAAADAIECGLLGKHGFTSAAASIDGRRGLAALMAYRFDADAITAGEAAA